MRYNLTLTAPSGVVYETWIVIVDSNVATTGEEWNLNSKISRIGLMDEIKHEIEIMDKKMGKESR